MNHKKMSQLYAEERLQVRRRKADVKEGHGNTRSH